MKTCSRCREQKPLDAFGRNANSKDGLRSQCRNCKSVENRAYREKSESQPAFEVDQSNCTIVTICHLCESGTRDVFIDPEEACLMLDRHRRLEHPRFILNVRGLFKMDADE